MSQWAKALAAKSNNLSSIPETCMVEGEYSLSQADPLNSTGKGACLHPIPPQHTHNNTSNYHTFTKKRNNVKILRMETTWGGGVEHRKLQPQSQVKLLILTQYPELCLWVGSIRCP